MDIHTLTERQRAFFETGATRPVKYRLEMLRRLKAAIQSREKEIAAALHADLNKSSFEAYMTEIGMVLDEIGFLIRHTPAWAKPKPVPTPMAQFSAKSFIW